MQRIFMMIALSVATSAYVAGQTNIPSVSSRDSKQEIIALSRDFVRDAISTHDERGETIDLENVSVRINGDRATFTARALLKGQTPSGLAYSHPHRLTIRYAKRGARWQFIHGEYKRAV